jgi:hypothetical protein
VISRLQFRVLSREIAHAKEAVSTPCAFAVLQNLGEFRSSIFGGGGVGGDHRIGVPGIQKQFREFR